MIANTPKPPYYAVIFSTLRTSVDDGYLETAERMEELAKQQEGFLGIESARNEVGITVSYWKSLDAILKNLDGSVKCSITSKAKIISNLISESKLSIVPT